MDFELHVQLLDKGFRVILFTCIIFELHKQHKILCQVHDEIVRDVEEKHRLHYPEK